MGGSVLKDFTFFFFSFHSFFVFKEKVSLMTVANKMKNKMNITLYRYIYKKKVEIIELTKKEAK